MLILENILEIARNSGLELSRYKYKFQYKHEDWTVLKVPKDSEYLMIGEIEHFGITDFESNTIYMNEDMVDTRYAKILIHELMHVVLNANGFAMIEELDHETVCEVVSNNFMDIVDILLEIGGQQ